MKRVYNLDLLEYSPILDSYGIKYEEVDPWLVIGNQKHHQKWILSISIRITQAVELLNAVLPILINYKIPFKVVRDQLAHSRVNGGVYGIQEMMKTITIIPGDINELLRLSNEINEITKELQGPLMPNCIRLGNIIYSCYSERDNGQNNLEISANKYYIPLNKKLPFKIDDAYKFKKTNWRIGKYYIPIKIMRQSYKGDIIKAVNAKKLDICIIKQGRKNSADDIFNRDMKDRLKWQKHVLEDIEQIIPAPKVIDYFEIEEDAYLVVNFIDGENFGEKIRKIKASKKWEIIEAKVKSKILTYYLKVLKIIKKIHLKGYVHRDITDTNLLIQDDSEVSIIDFEICYSILLKNPNPPFVYGTWGYVAPEQAKYSIPNYQEDIYALGSLLCFIITGVAPAYFIEEDENNTKIKLDTITNDNDIKLIILKCLNKDAEKRPSINELIVMVESNLRLLTQ